MRMWRTSTRAADMMTHRSDRFAEPQIEGSEDFRKAANSGVSLNVFGGRAKRLRSMISHLPPAVSAARTMRR